MVLLSAVRDLFATLHLIECFCDLNLFENGLAADIFALLELYFHSTLAEKDVTRHHFTCASRHYFNGVSYVVTIDTRTPIAHIQYHTVPLLYTFMHELKLNFKKRLLRVSKIVHEALRDI